MAPAPSDQDELLPSSGVPRWLRWGGAGAVVAVAAALVAVQLVPSTGGGSPSRPSTSAQTAPAHVPATQAAPDEAFGPARVAVAGASAVALPTGSGGAEAVVDHDDTTWVLTGGRLLSRQGSGTWRVVPVGGAIASAAESTMALDASAHRLWVVGLGAPDTIVEAYDSRTLQVQGLVGYPHEIDAIAALGGVLYVAGTGGLARVSTDGDRAPVTLPRGAQVLDLAADPARRRVLMLLGTHARLTIGVAGARGSVSSEPGPYGMGKGFLGVTGAGAIWAAGFGRNGSVLVRLDPATFRTVAVSPLANQTGPGALLLASGDSSIMISGANGASGLWCVDGRTGGVEQWWSVDADRAASARGLSYAVANGGLYRLDDSGGCAG